uniref:C2H2-type domain-containing protein n=1 Tax=Anopheles stephensi TaxID=30069 RepID=A0A182XVN0_ANOST
MVGSRRSVVGGVRSGGVKKEEILVNVQVNGNDEIDLVPVNKSADYGRGSSDDRDGDEEEEEDYEDLSDNPDSDPDLLETEDGRLILDMKRSKYCGRCKKIFKTSAVSERQQSRRALLLWDDHFNRNAHFQEQKAHKYKCPGVVDEVQDVILKERKAAKHANPGEEFHKYCNPNPDNPCYCCGEDVSTAHVGHIRCKFCPKSFKAYEYMERHLSSIHSEKFFTTKNAILLHQRTHLEENPVQCKVCSGTFKRSDCLMRHMRTKHRDFLDKIIDDTEKEKMEKLTTTKRETEKEAVVEIDGAIYQITTMDDAPAKGTAYTGNNQTVEVFEVVELPASASDAIPNTLPTTSVPYELVPVVDDTEVILGDSSPVEFVGKANTPIDVVVKKEEDSFKKVKSPPKATVVSKSSEPVAPKVVGKASEGEPSRKSVPSTSKTTATIKPKTEHVVAVRASNEPPQKTPPKLAKEIAREKEEPSTKLAKKPATLPTARPKEAKSRAVEEAKLKRKREPKPATPKRMRPDEDSIPIFLSDDMLEQKISELLQMLMGEDMLRSFGWPNAPVEVVLGRVIQGCGHQPAKGEEAGDHTTRMRENTKILFSVTMDDDDIKALLNNHTVDEVIMHVLKNK